MNNNRGKLLHGDGGGCEEKQNLNLLQRSGDQNDSTSPPKDERRKHRDAAQTHTQR